VGRIARAFGREAAVIGFDDEVSVLTLIEGDAETSAALCARIHAERGPQAPAWRAAVVDTTQATFHDVHALRAAAAELLASSPVDDTPIVRWNTDDASRAPDVIIIEDDVALATMLEYAMQTAGVSYRVFSDGMAALDALRVMQLHGSRPVVLLDVNLPGIDGHSLHERLRVERPGAFAVVYVSVRASDVEQVRALRAGAIDYFTKPINLRILMAKLPMWLGRTIDAA